MPLNSRGDFPIRTSTEGKVCNNVYGFEVVKDLCNKFQFNDDGDGGGWIAEQNRASYNGDDRKRSMHV